MRRVTLVAVVVSLLVAAPASAATLEPVGDFVSPTYLTSYPNDPDKLLVVERAGLVQLADHGAVSTFLDATSLVGTIDGERGMWSIALAPDFATTGVLYVFYAGSATGGDLQLDEFTASGDAVDLSTRRPVLTIEHSERANHNGGQLQFGPDGYLYISTGDGDRRAVNAQDLTVLLGKILRIDPRESGGAPYSVPGDNPFVGAAGEDEIWSYGLRNPYRFSFDRATGALAIGDVGRQRSEEIDYDPGPDPGRGDNYGWPCFEGSLVGGESDHVLCANPQDLVFPIQEYSHDDGFCSVIGGYVVRDRSLGDLYGRYLDTDLCAGLVRSLIPAVPQAVDERSEGLAVVRPVSFGEDACGRLYVLSLDGPVSRLVGDAPADCRAGFARVIGDVLTVTAGAEVANRLEVLPSDSGAEWVVQDGAAPLDAGPSCVQARVNRVRCPQAAISRIAVDSTGLGDRVRTPVGLPATIDAGAGNDRAFTGDGADALKGGPGNDELDGGAGPDTIDGGADRDTTTYATRGATEPVIVSLDGVADDGGALDGRDDNVLPNVENVIGGDGGDRLTGSAVRNALSGGAGNDVLDGGGGRDPLDGGDGRDTVLYGGRGPAEPVEVSLDGLANDGGAVDGGRDNVLATVENVVGGDGADTLTGSAVRNALTGGGGADALHGLGGEDVIRANGDGSTDEIACGAGRDHAFADPADVFVDPPPGACELVN